MSTTPDAYERTSHWDGPAHKGAMRQLRQFKREEAEQRNAATPPERRSIKRQLAQALASPQDGGAR